MSLELDPRQRAMLQEMGIRVWQPLPAPALAVVVAAQAPVAAPPAPRPGPETPALKPTVASPAGAKIVISQAPELAHGADLRSADVASLDWATLAQTIATCQACPLCTGRRAAVLAAPDAPHQADWLVVGEPPDDADERAGEPFVGAAGELLDNMLKALGLNRHAGASGVAGTAATAAYVTAVVKCRPAAARNPTGQELASCENYLRREVALVRPKIILALGRFAAQGLLQGTVPEVASTPLGQLRGQNYHYQGIPVIISYPPSYLLRSPQHKARAWLDLCRAQAALYGKSFATPHGGKSAP